MDLPAVEVSQSPEDKFREYLATQPRPKRFTEQRRDIIQIVFSQHDHFDADQLFDDLKKQNMSVSRATVYRTLSELLDAGLLRVIDVGQRTYYEHDYGYPQHDHMQCEKCNKIIEFQNPALDNIISAVSETEGFQVKRHSFVIHGVCAQCIRAQSIKRRLDLV